jgi:hypothetical protein
MGRGNSAPAKGDEMPPFGASQRELQAWQERLKLSNSEAADLLNAPYDTYRNWWYGHRGVPTPVALLMRYVEAYGPLTRERVDEVRRALEFYEQHREELAQRDADLKRLNEVRELLERARDFVQGGGLPALAPPVRAVLAALIEARLFGNDPLAGTVAIGAARLAELAGGLTRPAVQRAIKKLEAMPWFHVHAVGHGNGGGANVYKIDAAKLLEENHA